MGLEGYTPDAGNGLHQYSSYSGDVRDALPQTYPSAYPHYAPPHSYPSAHPQYAPPGLPRQQTRTRKRKATDVHGYEMGMPAAQPEFIDLTQDSPPKKRRTKNPKPATDDYDDDAKPKKKASKPKDEEKRLRRWRTHPPSSYVEVKDRALTQRMFVLDRQRNTTSADYPTETVSLAGTTGNIYTITIDKVPSCDCPHARKGNQCKHIAYVLIRVLRAPSQLEYQLAFVSAELREIFAKAPPLPSETADKDEEQDGNRKAVEGECPICCDDFEPNSGEKVVYCKAACGNNVHAACFKQWEATKKASGSAITCPFCRSPWQSNTNEEIARGAVPTTGVRNAEGYVNVANQLGLSGKRDYTSYNGHWVRRQVRDGEIGWDDDGVMSHDQY